MWRSRSSAAPRRRCGAGAAVRPGASGARPMHSDRGAGSSIRGPQRSSGAKRAPAASQPGEDAAIGTAQHGGPSGRRLERAGCTEPQPPLPGPGRRMDEPGDRTGRVLRGDAVSHGRQWYRVRHALQVTNGAAGRPPVSPRHGLSQVIHLAAVTKRGKTPGGLLPTFLVSGVRSRLRGGLASPAPEG